MNYWPIKKIIIEAYRTKQISREAFIRAWRKIIAKENKEKKYGCNDL